MNTATGHTQVLVDGSAFWASLERDILGACDSVCIQTLSLEGDAAGKALARALIACSAPKRLVLVDCFSLYFTSDRFVYAPHNLRDEAVRAEINETRLLIASLRAHGVEVRMTNPAGAFMHRFLARDHKKIAVIDGCIGYIGGINFCDHNFAWHDMMLRIECGDIAGALKTDFHATWDGVLAPAHTRCGEAELLNLDGARNEDTCRSILQAIDDAHDVIHVMSPYMTFPFTDALRRAVTRGVRVVIVTPAQNNRGFLRTYMRSECARSGFELRLFPGRMSHLKAMMIDDDCLVVGSSNFDWLTWHLLGEVVLITRDFETISQFKARVLQPDLAASLATPPASAWQAFALEAGMRIVASAARALCKPRLRAERIPVITTHPTLEEPCIAA